MTYTITIPDSLLPTLTAEVVARNASTIDDAPPIDGTGLLTAHCVTWLEDLQRESLRAFTTRYVELSPEDRAEVDAIIDSKRGA